VEQYLDKKNCLSGNPITADIVISIGRGIKDKDYFDKVLNLADILQAQVVGSRPRLDLGWLSIDREVGLSGLKVSSRICLTLGVSGTNFHTMGLLGSKLIISVNNDRKANIFNIANYCVVEDVRKIIDDLLVKTSRKRFENIFDIESFLLKYFCKYKTNKI
jgi:electron transfer flavoprotein, subunit alpha (etfA)